MRNPIEKLKSTAKDAAVGQQVTKKAEAVKTHVEKNKSAYISGGSGLMVGVLLGAAIFGGKGANVKALSDAFKININSPTTVVVCHCSRVR